MLIDPLFFTIASACAIVYALITPLNLWLFERVPKAHSFDDRVALRDNRWAIARVVRLASVFRRRVGRSPDRT